MADPLSVIASVIAVAGAAESLGKTLILFRSFKNAPDEILALNNELSDFTMIVRHVEAHILSEQDAIQPSPRLEYMIDLAKRAQDKLLQLDKIMQKLLKQEKSHSQRSSMRFHWVFEKSKISSLRMDLRDIKLNIVITG